MGNVDPHLPEDDTEVPQDRNQAPSTGRGDDTPVGSVGITRASAAWVATATSLVLLALLIVFVLQNQARVEIRLFGFARIVPLGMAMLIAAVVGGLVVAISGIARVVQLRRAVRRRTGKSGNGGD